MPREGIPAVAPVYASGLLPAPFDRAPIKWASVTKRVRDRAARWELLAGRVGLINRNPMAHDVLVGRVAALGRHTGIELDGGRKADLRLGDVVGLAFGHRYATNQYEGDVPPAQPLYDLMSQGGVCGRVLTAASSMPVPTKIQPLGFLLDERGQVVNLRQHAMRARPDSPRIPTILVVGSSMDAGKTTMVASIVAGLTASGAQVHAGKLTGTACVKDINAFGDAGACRVLDFNDAGFASTFRASEPELHEACDTLISNLSAGRPDFLVLEIADGVIQRETRLLLKHLKAHNLVDHYCVAVQDALSAPTCLEFLRANWGIQVAVVSGRATISPLSTAELASQVSCPCLDVAGLASPSVREFFECRSIGALSLHDSDIQAPRECSEHASELRLTAASLHGRH